MRGHYEDRTWQSDPTLYAPARYRRACRYRIFLPEPLAAFEPRLSTSTIATISDTERGLARVGARGGVALAPLARLLLRTEAIASSKVEGLQVGVRELARGEARADTGRRISRTTAEILANIDAMELAIEKAVAAARFDRDHVLAIHRRLMEHAPNRHVGGCVRTEQNWIGGNDYTPCGADFVPPPPDLVDSLLGDTCAAIDDDALPPVVHAALVHAQFETVHPFDDGNGRTGRTLIHVVLRRRGLTPGYVPPISVVFARERSAYIEGLTAYRDGDVDTWIEGFATSARRAADLADAYLDAVSGLQQRWRTMLVSGSNPRSDAAAWAVLEALPAHPVITSAVAGAATGRAKAAVHNALEQLEAAGVLQPLTGGRRNRSWEAAGLLDLIADLEAGDPPRSTS